MSFNPVCAGGIYPLPSSQYCPGSNCCEGRLCLDCHPELSEPGNGADQPSIPCRAKGIPAQCDCMSADVPWLMPKAYGCGRVHKCADDLDYPNLMFSNGDGNHSFLDGQLDGCEIPGHAPHTVTCVHAMGIMPTVFDPTSVGPAPPCCSASNTIIEADGFDIILHVEVPIELIIEDCCAYKFCLKSFLRDQIRIPLCVPAMQVKCSSDMLYLKTRVRLCQPYLVPPDVSVNASHSAACAPVPVSGRGLPLGGAGGMRLEVLMEACVVKLMPFGVLGADPYALQAPKYI